MANLQQGQACAHGNIFLTWLLRARVGPTHGWATRLSGIWGPLQRFSLSSHYSLQLDPGTVGSY